ncbi:MAG TPA: hypothetical protein VIJ14_06195, partial [Rhabdochlamydiaceae bacterium]
FIIQNCYNLTMLPSFGDIIKLLQSAVNQTAAIEVQGYILELQSQLHDLQGQIHEFREKDLKSQENSMTLQKEINLLQEQIKNAKDWESTKTEYEFRKSIGAWFHKTTSEAFCPKCFSNKQESPMRESPYGYLCPVCSLPLRKPGVSNNINF